MSMCTYEFHLHKCNCESEYYTNLIEGVPYGYTKTIV